MTEQEMQAQMDLTDARLRIANGGTVTPEEYRDIVSSLRGAVESRAAAVAANSRERQKARRKGKAAATPSLDPTDFFAGLQAK